MTSSRRLGELLVERKVLSREVLEVCLQREASEGRSLPAILVAEGVVGEKDLVAAIAAQQGKRFVDLASHVVPMELDGCVPASLARRLIAVAVERDGDRLVVAMAQGMATLRQVGLAHVRSGLTSVEELLRVVA